MIVLLFIGVFACSTAVIMIKAGTMDAVLLSSYRLLLAAILLIPLFIRDYRKQKQTIPTLLKRALLPGVFLGAHFISWIIGARLTPAANSTLIVNMIPVLTPFCLYFLAHERLNKWEIFGTVLAVLGVVVLTGGDRLLSADFFRGDMLCLFSMILLTFYLVLAKRNSAGSTVWLYCVPLYFIGGLLCLICSLFTADCFVSYSSNEWLMVLLLVLVPTIIGHSALNFCMLKMRGQVVAIAILSQFVFAGIMAYFLLGELPPAPFYPASALVVAGCILAIKFGPEK